MATSRAEVYHWPDGRGHFGPYGGLFVPETLMRPLAELRQGILALPGVSGLALDVTSKPPGTIEWE